MPAGALHRGRRRRGAGIAQLARDRGRGDARHAARVDQVEVGQVDGHVERDAVIADAAFDAEAERTDLARVRDRPDRTSSPGGRRAGRPPHRASRRSRRGRPRARGRGAGPSGRGRPGGRSGTPPAGPDRGRSPHRRARPGRPRCRGGPALRRRRGRAPDPTSDRGSGPPGARAGAAGRGWRRRPAPPRGASGAPARRGSRCVRAMTRRSAPVRGRPAPIRESASRSPRPHDSRTWSADRPGRPRADAPSAGQGRRTAVRRAAATGRAGRSGTARARAARPARRTART